MLHGCLSCVFLCLALAPDNDLEIGNIHRTYGYLGPTRPKGTGILPGDAAHFTFEIRNLKFDENGTAFYSIAIEVRDEQGKLFFEQKPYNSVVRNLLGGRSLPCSAHLEVPLDAVPGMHTWKITVKDRTTQRSAVLTGQGRILPADFGITQVGLFAEPDGRVPISAIGVVGDAVYLHLWLVGFGRDKDAKQPKIDVSLRFLDEVGKPTMAKPVVAKIDGGISPRERMAPIQFGLTLNRAGRFTIELTAEDRISGKSSRIVYPIRVFPLE